MSYRTASGPLNERRLLHHAKVGRFLDELRCHHGGLGADITIQLKNGSILRMHSPVAAAHSAFFRQLIVDKGPALHVDLSTTPRPDAVRRVVDFMYSGTIDADLNDFADLLHVAHTWEIGSLSELLETRLLEYSRQPSTLLKALDVAALNSSISTATRSTVLDSALKNFRQIVQSRSGFAKLSPNAVIALLSSDELPVNSELDVARIVLSYLHITGNRGLDEQLLCVIRIEHLDAAGLAELEHLVRSQDPTLTALLHRIVQSIKADMFRSQRPRRRFTASGAVPSIPAPIQRGNSKSRLSALQQPSQSRLGAMGVTPFGTSISQSPFHTGSSAQRALNSTFGTAPFADVRSQAFVNRQLRTTDSVSELRKVPDPFARQGGYDVLASRPQPNQVASVPQPRDLFEYSPYLEDRTQEVVNRDLRSKGSIYELRNVPDVFVESDRFDNYPDPFGTNRLPPQNSYQSAQPLGFQTTLGNRPGYSPYVEQGSQMAINRNMRSKNSVFEIRDVPDLFDASAGFGLTNQYNQQSLRNASTQTQADFVELPDPFGPPKQSTTLDMARAINAAGHRSSLNHHAPNQAPLKINQGVQGIGFVPAGQTLTSPSSNTSNAYKNLDGRQRYHDADSIIEISRVPDPFGLGGINARVLPQTDSSNVGFQQRPRYVTGQI